MLRTFDLICDICGTEKLMKVRGKPDFVDCPKCGHPCDMRNGYVEDHDSNHDDDDGGNQSLAGV